MTAPSARYDLTGRTALVSPAARVAQQSRLIISVLNDVQCLGCHRRRALCGRLAGRKPRLDRTTDCVLVDLQGHQRPVGSFTRSTEHTQQEVLRLYAQRLSAPGVLVRQLDRLSCVLGQIVKCDVHQCPMSDERRRLQRRYP